MDTTIENRAKHISILGRVALGIRCLEIFGEALGINREEKIIRLLRLLWDFTSTSQLDVWETQIHEFDPAFLQEEAALNDFKGVEVLTQAEALDYYKFYQQLPVDYLNSISLVIEIGRNNLYAGTGEYSSSTLVPLLELQRIMEQNQIPCPALEPFEKSHFSEFHGWGFPRERAFFFEDGLE